MCMGVLLACTYVHHMHMVATETEGSIKPTGLGVTDCGCWELNLGSLQEQPVLLTADSSLQPLDILYAFFM